VIISCLALLISAPMGPDCVPMASSLVATDEELLAGINF
jgi:hypothetical protein